MRAAVSQSKRNCHAVHAGRIILKALDEQRPKGQLPMQRTQEM
jgi:hypothetical protein